MVFPNSQVCIRDALNCCFCIIDQRTRPYECGVLLRFAVLLVALQATELSVPGFAAVAAANCECQRCGVPMCRRLCSRVDCHRCCKCCVYFDLRVGRRSATKRNHAVTSRCRDGLHPGQYPDQVGTDVEVREE